MALLVALIAVGFLPVLVLLYSGLNAHPFLGTEFRGWTLRWLAEALTDERFIRTFVIGTANAIVVGGWTVVLGFVLGIVLANDSRTVRLLIAVALGGAFLVPPTAYALNLLSVARLAGWDKGTPLTLLGLTLYSLPPAVLVIWAGLRTLDWSRFEAAVLLGAPTSQALLQYVVKPIRPVVVLAFFIGFFFAVDDLVFGVYIGPPGTDTSLTVRAWRDMRSDASPALAWISLAITALGGAVIYGISRLDLDVADMGSSSVAASEGAAGR